MKSPIIRICLWSTVLLASGALHAVPRAAKWSSEQATAWQAKQPWFVGCNFIPSTAINQLEMWQADTFEAAVIDRELGWAKGIGMNSARVYLHDLAYQQDPEGFLKRVDAFLEIADKHGIKTLLVFFDDCWLPEPKIGKQPEPVPSVHNSGWLKSPGLTALKEIAENNDATRKRLERYVKAVLTRFANDGRVMAWDLYNEPANKLPVEPSHELLKLVFAWAWEVNPSQPLTSGIWSDAQPVRAAQLASSDIITFHTYSPAKQTAAFMDKLAGECDRRIFLCTEFMARSSGSTFQACLPVFKQRNVGAICWGLVRGKTNTIWRWGTKEGAPEPEVWFHDVLHPDGAPYKAEEIETIRTIRDSQK